MKNSTHHPIAVIGTGLSGLCQALALAQNGFTIALIGPRATVKKNAQKDERTTAILDPGIAFLHSIGVWDSCRATATPLATMELMNGDDHYIFDAAEIDAPQFGFNVANAAMKDTLSALLGKHANVTWLDHQVTDLTHDAQGWMITMDDRTTCRCDLLIGADGRNSIVRQHAGIAIDTRDEEQAALVTIVKTEKPHYNTSVEWYYPGGPLTLVPMPKNRLAIVWCDDHDTQHARNRDAADTIGATLNTMTESRFGTLTVDAPIQIWPVKPMKAHSLVAPHTALVGEAAHVLAPIGAQGFNLSLQDIIALTHALCQGRNSGMACDNAAILARYERARLTDIIARYRGINALNDMIRTSSLRGRLLRRLTLNGLTRNAVFKRLLMQLGLGKNLGKNAPSPHDDTTIRQHCA